MKYLQLDELTLKVVDKFFNSRFENYMLNEQSVELYNIFPWTYDFNSEDIELMFEDLQKDIYLQNYVPKRYLKTPITFLNFILKQIPNLNTVYLKPYNTKKHFRNYYLKQR